MSADAFDHAIGYLVRAIGDTTEFTGQRLGEISVSDAILSATNALIASRHEQETERRKAMYAQIDVLRSIADALQARSDERQALRLTDRESLVVYRALEADYIQSGVPSSIQEMDAALLRFKKIAGL